MANMIPNANIAHPCYINQCKLKTQQDQSDNYHRHDVVQLLYIYFCVELVGGGSVINGACL